MASKLINSYVPKYMLENVPWYERDGLIRWYGQGKCAEFLKILINIFVRWKSSTSILYIDSVKVKWFRQIFWNTIKPLTKIQCLGILLLNKLKFIPAHLERTGKIFFFENETIKKHFKKIDNKKSRVLLRQSSF